MDPSADPRRSATSPAERPEGVEGVRLRCWGTRGSIPSPGPGTAGFGGNTSCLELVTGGRRIVFDAGSGLRLLGEQIVADDGGHEATVFLTHFHWDHIQGFPFFAPLYHPGSRLRIVGPMQRNVDVKALFAGQMGPIYFPVPFSALAAEIDFQHLNEGSVDLDGVTVSALRMRHPSFTVGYRVEVAGRRICYLPDNELEGGEYEIAEGWRERLLEFVGGSDLLLHDAMYTEEEYAGRTGWGHSTFRQALELAGEAGVARLLFFHHAPGRSDSELERRVVALRRTAEERGFDLEIDGAREGFHFTV